MRYILMITFMITYSMLFAQPEPTRDSYGDATFTDEGIWYKNMELICPINWEDGHHDESI